MKKKFILSLTSFIAFIILLGEIEEFTITIILLKIISLFWIWLVVKANNYFYQGD